MKAQRRQTGFTLVEVLIVVAVVGVTAAVAVPSMRKWAQNQRLADSARTLDGALSFARSEAIRTGNVHIVFVQEDADGNALVDDSGNTVQVMVIDDGRPAVSNCDIDAGEIVLTAMLEDGSAFGVANASAPVGTDPGNATITAGSTFEEPDGDAATWVLFRPEGSPRAFDSGCNTGNVGTGGGGFYVTNGERDAAVVLTPLGATRIHSSGAGGTWSG